MARKKIEYNDENLQRLITVMAPGQRLKILKGAFRREANNVRKVAVNNLRAGLQSNKDLEKGIRALVFKRKAGFRVTIGSKAKRYKRGKEKETWTGFGFHTNRHGKKKPVLIWAEEGTQWRRTKKHSTGRMKRYGFMQKTLTEVEAGVTDRVHKNISRSLIGIAKKYGCK